jgi:hypothetical protein
MDDGSAGTIMNMIIEIESRKAPKPPISKEERYLPGAYSSRYLETYR